MKIHHLLPLLLILSSCATTNVNSSSSQSSSVQSHSSQSISSQSSDSSDATSSNDQSSSENSLSHSSESESLSSSAIETGKYCTFKHKFKSSDFNKAGGEATINGIIWKYNAFTYLGGSAYGIQIGSRNSPQTTPWTLETTFPGEVKILSYSFEVSNAASGGGVYNVSFGDYNSSNNFASDNSLKAIYENEIEVTSTSFSLSLSTSAKAIYLYSLKIDFYIDNSLDFNPTMDNVIANPVVPNENDIPNINYQPIDVNEYYKNIDFNIAKEELILSLRNLISNMTKVNYESAKTMLQYTDENPDKPGYMYGLFDGDDIFAEWDSGATWNREHVWPCAQMKLDGTDPRPSASDKTHATDLHNLRAACSAANSKHSNKFYDKVDSTNTVYPNFTSLKGYHDYKGDFRGDVARIIFYMFIRYDGLELNDDLDSTNAVSMGKLSTLIEWNEIDPVDTFEIQRNNRIYAYQGNRNPFIDYPNLCSSIFE